MKVIILVAGRGTRLQGSWTKPKCLLDVGGRALLTRYLDSLSALNLPVRIVTGFQGDAIRQHVENLNLSIPVEYCRNDRFELGSILSLQVGLMGIEEPIVLLDGDVLFHPKLLTQLIDSQHNNALLVDPRSSFSDEEYMVGGEEGRVNVLTRGPIEGCPSIGEWVGFVRLGKVEVTLLKQAIEDQISNGNVKGGYEDALGSLLNDIPIRYELVNDFPWIEIDFDQDLLKARELVKVFPNES